MAYQNFTFAVSQGNFPKHLIKCLEDRGNWNLMLEEECIEQVDLYWRQTNLGFTGYDRIDKRLIKNPKPFIFNHFEVIAGITTKTQLITSLKSYYNANQDAIKCSYSVFDTTPTTFVINRAGDNRDLSSFMQRFKEVAAGGSRNERVPVKHCTENMWLVKPASLNQGRGIEVFKRLNDIIDFIWHRDQKHTFWVVQKYIERPFLYKQRKFDLRIWAAVTDDFRIYCYKQGYVRTSSTMYDLKNKNNFVHLTNQCLQVKDGAYGTFEQGNTLSFQQLQEYLDQEHGQYNLNIQEHFMPRVKDIMIDSFLSVRKKMNPNNRKNCFELFGFDFLLDEDFRIWLIEINTNPFLGTPNKYMEELVPKMIDDLLKIVVDPILKPRIVSPNDKNGFELIYKEGTTPVNVRRPFSQELLYPIKSLTPQIGKPPMTIHKFIKKPKKKTDYLQKQLPIYKKPETPVTRSRSPLVRQKIQPKWTKKQIDVKQRVVSPKEQTANFAFTHVVQKSPPSSLKTSRNNSVEFKAIQMVTPANLQATKLRQTEVLQQFVMSEGDDQDFNQAKKNFLQRTLFDECKELCNKQTNQKNFDQVFSKVFMRLQQPDLFDEEEVTQAVMSLKTMANSFQLANLIRIDYIGKVFNLFDQDETTLEAREAITNVFIVIAKNMSIRKILFKKEHLVPIMKLCFSILGQQESPNKRLVELSFTAIKVLCQACTVRTSRFYIPGETNIAEQLRKRSIDSGLIALLRHIHLNIKSIGLSEIKHYIDEKVLKHLNLADIDYEKRVFKLLIQEQDSPTILTSNLKPFDPFNEVDAYFNKKITIQEIWAEPPQIDFSEWLISKIDLASLLTIVCQRKSSLKEEADRIQEEEKKTAQFEKDLLLKQTQFLQAQREQRVSELEKKIALQKLKQSQKKIKDQKLMKEMSVYKNFLEKKNKMKSFVYQTESPINRKLVMLNAAYGVLTIIKTQSQKSLDDSGLDQYPSNAIDFEFKEQE